MQRINILINLVLLYLNREWLKDNRKHAIERLDALRGMKEEVDRLQVIIKSKMLKYYLFI